MSAKTNPDDDITYRRTTVAPGQILIAEPRRSAKDYRVSALQADIEMNGQFQPVILVETETVGKYDLIDGLHRLLAIKRAKISAVDAMIFDASTSAGFREYMQIMANINREQLTKLERAEHLVRLRKVWKELNPSARHGGDRRSDRVRQVKEDLLTAQGKSAILALSEQVAEAIGLSRRAFFLATGLITNIPEHHRVRIHGTWLADHQAQLSELAKADPPLQQKALDLLFSTPPRATSVAEALASASGRTPPDEAEVHFTRLKASWSRLSKKGQRAFLEENKRTILAHVKAAGWLD